MIIIDRKMTKKWSYLIKYYVKLTGQYRKPSDITPVPGDIQRYFVTRGVASSDKIPLNIGDINRYFVPRGAASRDKIPVNIGGYRCNIARFSVLAGSFYLYMSYRPGIVHTEET